MLEYHRILKLEVISEIIQPYLIVLEKKKFSDFLKYNILALFLLNWPSHIESIFLTNFTLYTVNVYHNSYKFYFPHLFISFFPQVCLVHLPFLHFMSWSPLPPIPNYILKDIKDQALFFCCPLSGPNTVPNLAMLNYCWVNTFHFCFDK